MKNYFHLPFEEVEIASIIAFSKTSLAFKFSTFLFAVFFTNTILATSHFNSIGICSYTHTNIEEVAPLSLATSEVIVSVNWPQWAGDNRVDVYNSADVLIQSICYPAQCYNQGAGSYTADINLGCLADGAGYYLNLLDSYGDGWNGGGTVSVTAGGVTVINALGLTGSSSGPHTFTVSGGGGICGPDPQSNSYEKVIDANFSSQCPTMTFFTYDVIDDVTITDINVGLNVSMTYRHHLTATLTSPNGTVVELTSQGAYGGGSATIANWDVLFDDASANGLNDGNSDDVASPFYELDRIVNPSGTLADFNGETSLGTWTINVCDYSTANGNGGTLHRFKLDVTGIPNCNISDAGVTVNSCNDEGTMGNTGDDTFTFSLNPTGAELGSTYSVSGDITASGISYGSATTFNDGGTGFLISNGDLSITITDDATGTCQLSGVTVTTPLSCSTCSIAAPLPIKN